MNLAKLKNLILEAVFPQFCLNCKKPGSPICYDCLSSIDISIYTFCPFCKTPQRVFAPLGKCPKHQNKKLDGLFSAVSYKQIVVKKLISNFKYQPYLKTLAKPLAFLIISHFELTQNKAISKYGENSKTATACFMPIPLSPRKKKQRGFNQAELIAKELSGAYNIPTVVNSLTKIKHTKPQVGLTEEQRTENIKNAFAVKNPNVIKQKIIFLIDDVFTTGATLEAAARVLKQTGAARVFGITIAREPLG